MTKKENIYFEASINSLARKVDQYDIINFLADNEIDYANYDFVFNVSRSAIYEFNLFSMNFESAKRMIMLDGFPLLGQEISVNLRLKNDVAENDNDKNEEVAKSVESDDKAEDSESNDSNDKAENSESHNSIELPIPDFIQSPIDDY